MNTFTAVNAVTTHMHSHQHSTGNHHPSYQHHWYHHQCGFQFALSFWVVLEHESEKARLTFKTELENRNRCNLHRISSDETKRSIRGKNRNISKNAQIVVNTIINTATNIEETSRKTVKHGYLDKTAFKMTQFVRTYSVKNSKNNAHDVNVVYLVAESQ
jgi:hypothetical protein